MKKIVPFALVVLFAAQAFAAVGWVRVDPPAVRWFAKPDYVDLDGIRHWTPTDAKCVEAGWVACEYGGNPADAVLDYSATPPLRDMTQDELDARAAAQAAAQAEAEAEANLPQVFPTGIAVIDENGHHVELLPTGDGLPVIGAQVSNSPLTKDQRDELKAAMKAAVAARKAEAAAAKKSGKLQRRIEALEAMLGVE
jgi:hypothetical protein